MKFVAMLFDANLKRQTFEFEADNNGLAEDHVRHVAQDPNMWEGIEAPKSYQWRRETAKRWHLGKV